MTKRSLITLGTLTIFLLSGCGSDEDATLEEEIEAAAEAMEEAPEPSGDSEDVQAFLTDYEGFIDKYCEMAENFAGASMTEKIQLTQNAAVEARKLSEYSSRAIALEAAFSESAQKRLEDLQTRADDCSEKFAG